MDFLFLPRMISGFKTRALHNAQRGRNLLSLRLRGLFRRGGLGPQAQSDSPKVPKADVETATQESVPVTAAPAIAEVAIREPAQVAPSRPIPARAAREARKPSGWSVPDVAFPPLKVFENITVVPATARYGYPDVIGNGGPLFPDFEQQVDLRYRIAGKAVDRIPPAPETVPETTAGEYLWGCYIRPHFGHLIQDHMSKMLVLAAQKPGLPILCVSDPVRRPNGAIDSFWEICDWFGIAKSRIKFVRVPMVVEKLYAASNPEHNTSGKPPLFFLKLLALNQARNRLAPIRSRYLYVSRVGMLGKFCGGHLGESYLAQVLTELGVTVFDPAAAPLRSQLAHLAGAEHIIFAEGSAIHGRQLLGKLEQDISILNRRPKRRMASGAMRGRCRTLNYFEVTQHAVYAVGKTGEVRTSSGVALYDLPELFRSFASIGIDVQSVWNTQAYHEAIAAEVQSWVDAMFRDFADIVDIDVSLAALEACGLDLRIERSSGEEGRAARVVLGDPVG